MADWYVSSAAYATYTAFQTSHAYTLGTIIVPTAPALKAKWVFRCTTAGTSTTEPSWISSNNGSSTSGTAVFTNITGQSSFFWTAAAGDIPSLTANRVQAGDRVFVSSDHSETQTSTSNYGSNSSATASFGVAQFLCVSRAGSTPPVVADLSTGATCTVSSGDVDLNSRFDVYHYGIVYVNTGTGLITFQANSNYLKSCYLKNCQLYLNNSNSSSVILGNFTTTITLDNTTVKFGSTAQSIQSTSGTFIGQFDLTWINTPSAIAGAIIPTTLFVPVVSNTYGFYTTVRGVDLSAITGTLVTNNASTFGGKLLFDSCKIASGVTRYSVTSVVNTRDEVMFINCYDGTNIISERYAPNGAVTTEFTITLSGGARDDVGSYSHKMVSNANIDKFVFPLEAFWMDVNNTTTGSSKTATVEIISSGSLNNDDVALYLEYEGTAGTSVTSFASSFIATALTTPVAVTTSTATWNSSPSTPVTQKLQVTFTPQVAGRLRGQVRLGKPSTTVYYNPQITVS